MSLEDLDVIREESEHALSGVIDAIEQGVLDDSPELSGMLLGSLEDGDLGKVVSPTLFKKASILSPVVRQAMSFNLARQADFTLRPNYSITMRTTHVGAGALTSTAVEMRPVGAGRGDDKKRLTLIQMAGTLGTQATIFEGATVQDVLVNESPTFATVGVPSPIPFRLLMPEMYQNNYFRPFLLSNVDFRTGDTASIVINAPAAGTYEITLQFVTDYTVRCHEKRTPSALSGPAAMAAAKLAQNIMKLKAAGGIRFPTLRK